MPLQIIHRDITTMTVDAVVNPTDCLYSGSGGTDLAIHRAAGSELIRACGELKPLSFGEVAVTEGFNLPCRHIIHTMGPVWRGGNSNETMLLRSCYVNALIEARKMGLTSLAFPLISSGTFGFPKDRVLRIAIDAISDFLFSVDEDMEIYICVLQRNAFELSKTVALEEYIDRSRRFVYENHALTMSAAEDMCFGAMPCEVSLEDAYIKPAPKAARAKMPQDLSTWLKKQDDSFAVTLLKLIDKKHMGDVQCYKKANVTKNTFWKIKNQADYKPSKPTVIAFAIALELNMEETELLLKSAGFSLSHNNLFDMIIEFYILNGYYDIFEINAALYQYDQQCLGC